MDESKSKTAIVSHRFCPTRLVLQSWAEGEGVGGGGGGGWLGWGRMGVKVTGLTLIINNFETNKQNLPT